jgi:Tfp pilus assembly protein PilF
MLFELWWLMALPVFFALGWMAARVDARQVLRASARLPDAYFTGLNFLLNEQPDKAIDAFIDVVKLDPETVALHFALGNLFRRRGETDRAIRVHQSLLSVVIYRPDNASRLCLSWDTIFCERGCSIAQKMRWFDLKAAPMQRLVRACVLKLLRWFGIGPERLSWPCVPLGILVLTHGR